MSFKKSSYFGIGIIFAPRSKEYNAGIVINFLIWEFSYHWGLSIMEEEQVQILKKRIKELAKKHK